jgi:hypothetical protein
MRGLRRVLAFCCVFGFIAVSTAGLSAQANPALGTWRLVLEKSTYSAGKPNIKSQVITIEPADDGFKTIVETVDLKGQTSRTERVGRFDGKDNPVVGGAAGATVAYSLIEPSTYQIQNKINGKVTTTTRTVVAPDKKSFTNTTTGYTAQGQSVHNVVVYERQ